MISLDRPADRAFILDNAGLLNEADKQKIHTVCDKLLTDNAIPIEVVTIDSMARYGQPSIGIGGFATLLFDQWGIGYKEVNGAAWNRGILFLVSAQDRKARIELGADWGRGYDATTQRIMEEQIIYRFRQGNFSGGIVAGVTSLDRMARGIAIPAKPVEWWQYALVVVSIGLTIFTGVSLFRRGASGWAWLFWGSLFAAIGYMLYQSITSSGSSSGGSFSGGSFGGGFSGGGGATGSW